MSEPRKHAVNNFALSFSQLWIKARCPPGSRMARENLHTNPWTNMRSSHSQIYCIPALSLTGFSFTSCVWTTTAYSWFAVTKGDYSLLFPIFNPTYATESLSNWGENPPFSSRAVTQHGRRAFSRTPQHCESLQERMYKDSRCFLGSHSSQNFLVQSFSTML